MSQRAQLVVAHAGVVGGLLDQALVPSFSAEEGAEVKLVAGHSVALARQIARGDLLPDVYISADAEVNRRVSADAAAASWFLTFAGVAMTLIVGPRSRFRDALVGGSGQQHWYEVVQQAGFVLKRNDPNDDPGGYRAVFVAQLAEAHYGVAGLARAILGDDENPGQTTGGGLSALLEGSVDAMLTYASLAAERALPHVALPPAINLGDPQLATTYARASFTTSDGLRFHGTPARLSVTIPRKAANRALAERFLARLLSREGQASLRQRGFLPSQILMGGAKADVPHALAGFAHGDYAA